MHTKVIKADSIDTAVERILDELKEDDTARSISFRNNNVIYFDGWDGLGASAVLRAVARRLAVASEAPAGLKFDQIIHVDCSKWEGRRVLQRAIAEQLELPAPLMDMLDWQDEEDEFNGVRPASRLEIPQVLRGMHRRIQDLNRRFLVIFHNGSNEEIDLASFGFPLSQYLDNKVLWTFQGRFRLYPRNKVVGAMKSKAGTSKTEVFLSACHSLRGKVPQDLCTDLLHQEATEVVAESKITVITSNGPAQVGEHFLLHMLKLCCIGHNLLMDYDLATHACNYWICDGIIQRQGDDANTDGNDEGLWRAARALQHEMRLDVGYYRYEPEHFPSQLVWFGMCMMPNKTSPPYGFLVVPTGAIPNADMFQDSNKLSVLKLSRRTFSFSSPPFIYCRNLKFLWLDHCQDQDHSTIDGFPQEEDEGKVTTDGAGTEHDFQRFFQRLWVLDVRYTCCDQILSTRMLDFMTQLRELNVMGAQDWDICQLQGRLPNIRKLRVTNSTLDCSEPNLFLGMSKMELLDLSGNRSTQEGVTKLSGICTGSNQLETVMITDGWAGIQKFSFTGCAKLKNVLLSGFFEDLRILDLSGTAVTTVDLSGMTAQKMDGLFLDNCEELCAVLWPQINIWTQMKLHIDTTRSAASLVSWEEKSKAGRTIPTAMRASSGLLSVVHGSKVPSEFDWCIVLRDARLLRSLARFIEYINRKLVHVELSSCVVAFGSGKDNEAVSTSSSIKQQQQQQQLVLGGVEQPEHNWIYADVAATFKDHLLLQAGEGDGDAPTLTRVWSCPRIPHLDDLTWYMHIQDHQVRRTKPMQEGEETIPGIICDIAAILHVHDSSSITSIPCPAPTPTVRSTWPCLSWCRVERCPSLERVFTAPKTHQTTYVTFEQLKTFWASRLLKAHCIWNWVTRVLDGPDVQGQPYELSSFQDLTSLHLELCPRLIYVLSTEATLKYIMHTGLFCTSGLYNLQTLEIMWCGALREVFSSKHVDVFSKQVYGHNYPTSVILRNLKHLHLHELPMLQGICGHWRIIAPNLETVKIRGCWSLRRLPDIWTPLLHLQYIKRHDVYMTMERRFRESGYGRSQLRKVHCDCEKEWWDRLEWEGLDHDHRSWYEPTHPRYYKKTLLKGSVLI